MKLTEIKNSINEALRLQDDYDVRIITEDGSVDKMECGVDSGRFNFNIYTDLPSCEEYHIENDDDMRYCSKCKIHIPSGESCPGCELKEVRKRLKLM